MTRPTLQAQAAAVREEPCTAASPNKSARVHPDAVEVGGQRDGWPGGDWITLQCPHCGREWDEELPQ